MADNNHPVWDVYDLLRLSCLNSKYYSRKLLRVERLNLGIELFLALSTSLAVAGLVTSFGVGKAVWGAVGAISSILLAVKPVLNFPKRIKEYETIVTGYRLLHNDTFEIKVSVAQKQSYDTTLKAEFRRALKRHGQLVIRAPAAKEDTALKRECEAECLKQYPVDSFYIPPR